MKPILATTVKDINQLKYPLLASFKIDGIRCIVINNDGVIKVLSRSLKPIRNDYIRNKLEFHFKDLPEGCFVDGELLAGNNFQDCSSSIMSIKGTPEFTYNIFDYVEDVNEPFKTRVLKTKQYCKGRVRNVSHKLVHSSEEIPPLIEQADEGIILRCPEGRYKFGRSTLKEQIIVKIKSFVDKEFIVEGFTPYKRNLNKSKTNELGYKQKSKTKDDVEVLDILGALIVSDNNISFSVGSGFTEEQRKNLWVIRDSLVGKLVKVKYMEVGVKDKPRHPVFLGFREEDDLGN